VFDKSLSFLNSAIDNIENGNLDKASRNISKMESFLPIGRYEGTNRLCIRYATIVSNFCDDNYNVKSNEKTFKSNLTEIGKYLKKKMSGKNVETDITYRLNNLQEKLIYTPEIDKFDKDSDLDQKLRSNFEMKNT